MNSRKKAQKAQKKRAFGNYLTAWPSALEGSRFAVLQLYRLAAGGSRERLLRPPFANSDLCSDHAANMRIHRLYFCVFYAFLRLLEILPLP